MPWRFKGNLQARHRRDFGLLRPALVMAHWRRVRRLTPGDAGRPGAGFWGSGFRAASENGARERQGRAMTDLARIEIVYCRQCRWLLRAAWMAQELLSTFETELGGIALVPGTGGVFEIRLGDDVIWSRQEMERFPDIKELKQLVRDRVAPERDLGHSEPDGAKS